MQSSNATEVTVVTGASGHAGANLVRALVKRGRRVRAMVHRDSRSLDGLDVEVVRGDVTDPDSLNRAFQGADVVYNLAARISLGMDSWTSVERINVAGPRNVVEACLCCRVRRLVHFSSIHALEQRPFCDPVYETNPYVRPKGCPPYDRSKAAGEQEILKGIERGLNAVIVRPTGIIGPYDYQPSYFGWALTLMANGKLPALVHGGFDWVDARDVAEGAIRAEEKAPPGAKYLLSGHWVSLREAAALIEELTGVPHPKLIVPLWVAYLGLPFTAAQAKLAGTPQLFTRMSLRSLHCNKNISHESATRELGYATRPFRETLADTLSWFREAGMLSGSSKSKAVTR